MADLVRNICVENYKSIKYLMMDGLKRFNIIIGCPNVGKSNILEAISLFSAPYLYYTGRDFNELVRFDNYQTLFHNGNVAETIKVTVDGETSVSLHFRNEGGMRSIDYDNALSYSKGTPITIKGNGITNKPNQLPAIKRYIFNTIHRKPKADFDFLLPMYGDNIMSVLSGNEELMTRFKQELKKFNLDLFLDKGSDEIRVFRKDEKTSAIFSLPFESLSDTLQRMMFYETAIESNRNSILLFEEPEAHEYPPYISKFVQAVLESDTNQYFITTHSPYVLNDFLEKDMDNLSVFIVEYDGNQTSARRLTEEQVDEVYNNGVDLFFNTDIFSR